MRKAICALFTQFVHASYYFPSPRRMVSDFKHLTRRHGQRRLVYVIVDIVSLVNSSWPGKTE